MLALLSRSYVVYLAFGAITRLTGRIESVHLTYPAEPRFREAYTFQARYLQRLYRTLAWTPSPIAVFKQGGASGVVFAVPADEKELLHPENSDNLHLLFRRVRLIQRLIGASQVTLAGVLPSHVARGEINLGALVIEDPRPATQRALLSAIDQVIQNDFDGIRPPILVFGGAGYIGADLADALRMNGDAPVIIDVKAPGESAETCLARFKGQAVLLVDVARRRSIVPIIPLLWPELVLLNETYPEPSGPMLAELRARGVRIRHVAGVEGTLRPNLPGGYSGAVPCCAAHRINDSTRAVLKTL